MAIGWKMLFADMLVMLAVAVCPTLLKVEVSTNDIVADTFTDIEGNGCLVGFPDVSRVVCTTYEKTCG